MTEGEKVYTYDYHADGQLASANYGETSESFLWDGLALVKRGESSFINEPHVGGGNPVVSSEGTSYFNDMLGTTVGSKSNGKYSAAALTAFGERLDNVDSTSPAIRSLGEGWFTGKPYVEGLGRTFLMRNYRASFGKWQTADPLGYPDGWNALAYCNNGVTSAVDLWGGAAVVVKDLNANQNIANTSQLYVGQNVRGTVGDENGSCQLAYSYVKATNYKLVFYLYIGVDVDARPSREFESDSVAEYREHQGDLSDSRLTPVYEAVKEHELGHAGYAVNTLKTYLKSALDILEASWIESCGGLEWLSDDKIDELYDRVFKRYSADYANAANEPTITWFESSPDWVNIKDGSVDHVWKWIKE